MASSKAIGFLNFKFGADLGGFERAMKKAERNLKKFGKNIQKTGKNLTTGLTLPIVALGAASVKAFDQQQKAIAQVEAGLKSTAQVAGFTSEELQKMAADLQKTSLFGDEEILKNATAQLLTFTNITGEQFAKTQEIALDLATRLDGDLKSASIMLGKALNDPVANLSALSRAGIQFSADQKQLVNSLVETGNIAEAQTIILEELEKQYGGSAEAARKAGLGPVQALQNTLSDLSEQIGERLLPVITKFTEFIVGLMQKFDNLSPKTKDFVVAIGLMVAGIGPLLILIGKMSIGVAALSGAFRTLTAVMMKNPIGFIAVALTTALGAWYSYNEIVKATTRSQNAFNGVAESTDDAVKRITKSVTGMGKDAFQTQIDEINDLINTIKGFEIKESQFTKGVKLSEKQTKQIQDLNMLLFRLEKRQAKAKEETEKLKKSFENLGNETENEKEKITALNIELAHTKQISESLTPSLPTKSFEDVTGWVTKLTEEQKLAIEGFKMFGDVVTSSLDQALSSQEKFFPLFIENLKKAIKQLLVQAAVMTVIASIMPTSLAGSSGLSTNFVTNLGSILGVSEFAQGGLVTGPTLGLIGEGIGTTASNPEVIAPLDRLKQFMGGGTQNVVVEGVIKGNDIFLSNRNTGYNRQRSV
jgi:hypothetical protein